MMQSNRNPFNITLMICVLLFFGHQSIANASENLIQNPGAEAGIEHWLDRKGCSSSQHRVIEPRSGDYLFSVSGYCSQIVDVSDYSTAIDSGHLDIHAQVWTTTLKNNLHRKFDLMVQYFDKDGIPLDKVNTGLVSPAFDAFIWKKTEFTDTVPSNTRLLKLNFKTNGAIVFDDIVLSAITNQPPPQPIEYQQPAQQVVPISTHDQSQDPHQQSTATTNALPAKSANEGDQDETTTTSLGANHQLHSGSGSLIQKTEGTDHIDALVNDLYKKYSRD
jgi:hypothetical protein